MSTTNTRLDCLMAGDVIDFDAKTGNYALDEKFHRITGRKVVTTVNATKTGASTGTRGGLRKVFVNFEDGTQFAAVSQTKLPVVQ